ncbi:MerR family transcriptional regulator [Litchfieldella qijiaojingensis]|uniref:Mercuric resistance operon regulatory protein n=1 Tax=Litchfieldella qijiaojingensis TaxID=980347 RepID=A0ABQ2YL28_9GAMM|nr:Hg(II)-responsive transcriptional regulator [Halomonas qijiaojingensis]GGX86439.1 MerR family transcriptional regulator [Halomonas qijiaojingensis]
MQKEAETMTIGGLAKAAGVNVETIRYYQRRGLLPEPERPYGSIRRYSNSDAERLTFIRSAQRLGFSLNEIAELLRLEDGTHCEEASALAEHKLEDVRKKLAGLQRIERTLVRLVEACHQHNTNISCPLIASLHEGLSTGADECLATDVCCHENSRSP